MARYNEIQSGRFARALQKLFGIKGEVPVGSLAGELQPVHWFIEGREHAIIEGWRLWAQSQSVAASVGNLSAARLRNSSKNMVAVVEKILLHTSSAATGCAIDRLPDPGTNFTNLRTPVARDWRNGLSPSSTGSSNVICTDGNPAAVAANTAQQLFGVLQTNVMWDFIWPPEQELIIAPGDALDIYVLNTNTILNYNVFWRERTLEEGEFTG